MWIWTTIDTLTHETWSIQEEWVAARAVGAHLHWMLMEWRKNKVDDVAGYHCQAWKCVKSNIGLQKAKKNKNNNNKLDQIGRAIFK